MAMILFLYLFELIAISTGFQQISHPPTATGLVDSDISEKFKLAFEALFGIPTTSSHSAEENNKSEANPFSFVFLHVKGTDEASHNSEPLEKKRILEEIDSNLGLFLRRFREHNSNQPSEDSLVVVFTGDHTTPCSLADHAPDPVPFLISLISRSSDISANPPLDHSSILPTEDVLQNKLPHFSFGESFCTFGSLGRFTGDFVLSIIHAFQEEGIRSNGKS